MRENGGAKIETVAHISVFIEFGFRFTKEGVILIRSSTSVNIWGVRNY